MAKKYSRDEVIKHAKALGMSVPDNAATMSKSDYKDFTNNLNEFKAEEKHKTEPAKEKAKKYRDTAEGKNYVAKAKEVKKRAEAGGDTSGEYSIDDLPASVRREIDKEIPLEAFNYTEGLLSQIRQASPFVTGARSGGRMDYTTRGGSVKENTDYVNRYPDLKRAWQEILNNPNSETARYWLPRMGVTSPEDIKIERFGMAHQAENAKLASGTYVGDTWVYESPENRNKWLEGKDPATGQRDPTSDYWKGKTLDPNETTSVLDTTDVTDTSLLDYTGPPGGLGTGVGGLLATTPYPQPAPQDWSGIRPGVFGQPSSELAVATGLPAQQAIFGPQGRSMQPWTTAQQTSNNWQVPAGLINYQIPGGAPVNVGYSNPNLGLFDFGGAGAGAGAGAGTGIGNQAWVGPGGVTDFNAWQDAEYERMYPGRRAAAQAAGFAGLDYWKPGAAEWRASLPGGATSQDWVNMYGTQAQQAAGQTAAERIAAGFIGMDDVDEMNVPSGWNVPGEGTRG